MQHVTGYLNLMTGIAKCPSNANHWIMEVMTDGRNRKKQRYMKQIYDATYILHHDTRERKHVICGSAALQERRHIKKNYYKVRFNSVN